LAAHSMNREGGRRRRGAASWLMWLPVAGVGGFILLYFVAASLYPGGTKLDPTTRGYSHLSNYWCDLLDPVSYSGAVNRARPVGMLATIILPLSLIPLWLRVPVLFRRPSGIPGWMVRVAGTTSMVCATLIFTPQHDLLIDVAAGFGGTALVLTAVELARARRFALLGLAVVGFLFAAANWAMWHRKGVFLAATPLVERFAYAAFLLWALAATRAIRRARSAPAEREQGDHPERR
jgi:hypothetical protein